MPRKNPKQKKRKTTGSDAPDVAELEKIAQEDTTDAGQPPESSSASEGEPTTVPPDAPKKRGRPRGSKTRGEESDTEIIPGVIIRSVVALPYTLAAAQYGEHWKLSEPEIDSMVPLHMELAREYLPEWLKQHPALYGCLLLHALAIIGRVGIQRDIERVQEAAEGPGAGNDGSENFSGKTRFGEIIRTSRSSPTVPPSSPL